MTDVHQHQTYKLDSPADPKRIVKTIVVLRSDWVAHKARPKRTSLSMEQVLTHCAHTHLHT